jgi:hypothetical protein
MRRVIDAQPWKIYTSEESSQNTNPGHVEQDYASIADIRLSSAFSYRLRNVLMQEVETAAEMMPSSRSGYPTCHRICHRKWGVGRMIPHYWMPELRFVSSVGERSEPYTVRLKGYRVGAACVSVEPCVDPAKKEM